MTRSKHFNIVGGGLSGSLLAILLAQRGFEVDVFERRGDPRRAAPDDGRSINLALAARGLAALTAAAVIDRIQPLLIAMRGRMLHEPGASAQLLPYGSRSDEVIWSVSRSALNRALIEVAATQPGIRLHFATTCLGADVKANTLLLRDRCTGTARTVPLTATIGADGAGSALRQSLKAARLIAVHEEPLDHDYKQMTIPAADGNYAMDPHALHIWPRGSFMLIALPNPDHSFTATLFLPKHGSPSFETLGDAASVKSFFASYFPDTAALMPNQAQEFLAHAQGMLGTISCDRWHIAGQVLLLGDAAHAIVPFHGQGANCAFEDCVMLARLLDSRAGKLNDLAELFAEFQASRLDNALAIAQMALENYTEMRDSVRDQRFQRLNLLSLELERRQPLRFIPRYSMVMFHADITYAEALRRGAVQAQILDDLDHATLGSDTDYSLADQLIEARLSPLRSSTK